MTEYGKNSDDKQIVDKRIEYCNYIDEHINNVKLAYKKLFIDRNPVIPGYENNVSDVLEYLRKRIMIHDASKYQDEEFEAYRRHFYPTESEKAKGESAEDAKLYEEALKHHYTHNPHHPEYWRWVKITECREFNMPRKYIILPTPLDTPLDMDIISILEMFCDWEAMSIKFNNPTPKWWKNDAEDERKAMSPGTLSKVEELMGIFYGD